MSFEKGDKVMFLGAPDSDFEASACAKADSLIPMKVYTVKGWTFISESIHLEGAFYWQRGRYFQKVEEKL